MFDKNFFSSKLLIRTLDLLKGPGLFLSHAKPRFAPARRVLSAQISDHLRHAKTYQAKTHRIIRDKIRTSPVLMSVILLQIMVLAGSCSTSSPMTAHSGNAPSGFETNTVSLTPAERQKRSALEKDLAAGNITLTDMTAADITLLLNQPRLTRVEAQNIAMHFESAQCAMDVYFRGAAAGDATILETAKAAYIDIRDKTDAPSGYINDTKSCVRSLMSTAYAQYSEAQRMTGKKKPS